MVGEERPAVPTYKRSRNIQAHSYPPSLRKVTRFSPDNNSNVCIDYFFPLWTDHMIIPIDSAPCFDSLFSFRSEIRSRALQVLYGFVIQKKPNILEEMRTQGAFRAIARITDEVNGIAIIFLHATYNLRISTVISGLYYTGSMINT